MAIVYDHENRTFTLHTDRSSYQMQVDPYGYLLHLYYGKRTEGCMDYLLCRGDRGFSGNPSDAGDDRTESPDYLPMEFPAGGSGDFRSPVIVVRDENGSFGCDLRYRDYEIRKGKYALKGLPAVYAGGEEDEAETLLIRLENRRLGLIVTLYYGVLPHLDIITRSAVVTNDGNGRFSVEKLQTACLDFVTGDYDLTLFHGRHAMERSPERRPVLSGALQIGSRRGASSHQYNPFVILSERDCTETAGRCWAMQLVYSGGFSAEAERSQYGETRLQLGLDAERLSYPLDPGESLTAPEVILSYSNKGFERLSHQLHRCLREHVCRGPWRDVPRPILLNSWEAAYFNFTGETILELAKEAGQLGLDLLVMDDGWFGRREDDRSSLGDWRANERKLGRSLGELIRQVREEGLRFGIWMEPEMISEESELYRLHPDWALAIPGEKPIRSRCQLVLDLSRREVCDYLFKAICEVLDQGEIDYLKWDVNRSIAETYSATAENQGKVLYDYMLGLYDLLERLLQRYPKLLIEGCSGGGGRYDAGMLYYTPQIWCSDNTDALDRLQIQYGTSFGYPMSMMGAHVSACPNHQTGRSVPLETRIVTALCGGGFGFELDPAKLSEEEKSEIRLAAERRRQEEELTREGLYYRLSDPQKEEVAAWSFVSETGDEALICAVLQTTHGNPLPQYVRPRGLREGALYRSRETGRIYAADALMETGFPLPPELGERESFVMHLERLA